MQITNYTRRLETLKEGWAFESEARSGEILVFCLSRQDTTRIREAFKAHACVEIRSPREFYKRVERALGGVSLPGKPGRERIGHPVTYYEPGNPPDVRWALPDVIALSKFDVFSWQHEQRLVYSRTNALAFQNVKMQLVKQASPRIVDASTHRHEDINVGDLSDIAILHEF